MNPLVDTILVVVMLLNFVILASSRIRTMIQLVATMGALLGVTMLFAPETPSLRLVLLAAASILLKGVVLPKVLVYAQREIALGREVVPHIGAIASLLLGAVVTGVALLYANTLPLAPEHAETLLVPASLSTVFVGFLIMSTRLTAIVQVVGFLVLENGIFIFGLSLLEAMPFLVEVGVLLDLFVLIFGMGIIINRISQQFASVDAQELSVLKD